MAGYQLSPQQMSDLRTVVRGWFNQIATQHRFASPQGSNAPRTVVLDAALAAATNALTSPGTATASVLRRNSSGNLEDAGYNITVVNRFESVSLAQYTIGVATWVDGEWRMTSADCDALAGWP